MDHVLWIYDLCQFSGNQHLHPDSHSVHNRALGRAVVASAVASLEEKSPFFKMLPEKVQDWYFEEPLGGDHGGRFKEVWQTGLGWMAGWMAPLIDVFIWSGKWWLTGWNGVPNFGQTHIFNSVILGSQFKSTLCWLQLGFQQWCLATSLAGVCFLRKRNLKQFLGRHFWVSLGLPLAAFVCTCIPKVWCSSHWWLSRLSQQLQLRSAKADA